MTYVEYDNLSGSLKARELFANGINVCRRTVNERMFFLYHLYSFYVEVCYNYEYNKIEKIMPFEEIDFLEPYIESIDLSALGFRSLF
jgi:hypothetical protein